MIVTTSTLCLIPTAFFPTYSATKAFLHSWLQSHHQLRTSPVEVLELVPSYVRTGLTGPRQASDPRGMSVDDFVSEVLGLLEAEDHPAGEILVERARIERSAERSGGYETVSATMNPA